ncbi:MAG: chorismate synthase [Caldisericaceae bacterium]|nr:chorismate synthase [Caldisericaceae bacterium]
MIKYVSAGDSHGEMLIGIMENLPAGLTVNEEEINFYLSLRQRGYGRGTRMRIENDKIHIVSGVSNGKTTGAPLGFLVKNRDFEINKTKREFTVPRPGHSDYAGSVKYAFENAAIPSERTSARITATDVAAGALLLEYLKLFGIKIFFFVKSVGKFSVRSFPFDKKTFEYALSNDLLAPSEDAYSGFKREIDEAIKRRDSIGGEGIAVLKNVPPGIGGYGNFTDKLDGIIAQFVMSVPSVKYVEIGNFDSSKFGSEFHDEMFVKDGKIFRKTNNAGGIEGGLSNGEDIIVKFGFKPIPTVLRGVRSVDIKDFSSRKTVYVRSDTCVVPAGTVVSAMKISIALSQVLSEQFGGDTVSDVSDNFRRYLLRRKKFWQR